MSTAANTALLYGVVATVVSGAIGYGIGIVFRHSVFKDRKRTVGVTLGLGVVAVILLLGGVAIQELVFGQRMSVAPALMVLIFLGTVWRGLSHEKHASGVSRSTDSPQNHREENVQSDAVQKTAHGSSLSMSVGNEKEEVSLEDDSLYEEAWKETEAGEVDQGLWARCFAKSDGDENMTKALYLEARVAHFKEREHRKRKAAREQQMQSELKACWKEYVDDIVRVIKDNPELGGYGNLELRNKWGETKLIEAAQKGEYEEVLRLLAAGANPTVTDLYTGATARVLAERNRYPNIARLLEIAEHVWEHGPRDDKHKGVFGRAFG